VTREIIIETTETILTLDRGSSIRPQCNQCGEGSRLLPLEEIVSTLAIDAIQLRRWLTEGRVHFQLSEKGALAICWKALSALLEEEREISTGSSPYSSKAPPPSERRIDRATAEKTKSQGPKRSP